MMRINVLFPSPSHDDTFVVILIFIQWYIQPQCRFMPLAQQEHFLGRNGRTGVCWPLSLLRSSLSVVTYLCIWVLCDVCAYIYYAAYMICSCNFSFYCPFVFREVIRGKTSISFLLIMLGIVMIQSLCVVRRQNVDGWPRQQITCCPSKSI